MKKPNNIILIIQTILFLIGAITAIIMFKRLFDGSPDILTILNSIIHIGVYLFIIIYASFNYNKDDLHFRLCVYAYAALLGIEILYSGNMLKDMGLSEMNTLIVNTCNLIAFANVIKFVDILDNKKVALIYLSISNILKLLVELYLIISMINFVQTIHILTALSVPILGFTILIAYMHSFGN